MNLKKILCAIMLVATSISIGAEEVSLQNESSLMALIRSPLLFVKGCKSIAGSFSVGSSQISESLDNTGDNIKDAGECIQGGLTFAAQSIKDAAEQVSVIEHNHRWTSESRQLGNAVVKESAVSVFGLAVSLTGLYIVYQVIQKFFLSKDKAPKDEKTKYNKSLFQQVKSSLQKNIRSITVGLVGSSLIPAGLCMIRNNSYVANTLLI